MTDALRCTRFGEAPYWAVLFTAVRTIADGDGYAEAAQRMEQLAAVQPGSLGLEAAAAWKGVTEHRAA